MKTLTTALTLSLALLIADPAARAADTGPTGGGQAHNNMQPYLALNYLIALDGLFPSLAVPGGEATVEPAFSGIDPYLGSIGIFAGNFAPRGWAKCDGQLLPINQNQSLYSIIGTTYGGDGRTTIALPDLRGRTPIHFGQGSGLTNRPIGQKVGTETAALSETQLPSHSHTLPPYSASTYDTGGGAAHENMQPSLAVNYIIALEGTFPSLTAPAGAASEGEVSALSADPLIGEVGLFAGNFAPRSWAFCNGQLLQISQHTALFSIIGTTYGGDGRTTFALPDLQGRAAMGPGSGPGLSTRSLGQRLGDEQVTLAESTMPSHDHTRPPTTDLTGETGGDQPHENVQPSLGLNYIIALMGVYPSESVLAGEGPDGEVFPASVEPSIGEITLFAGNFAPHGWALCDGQLLSIPQHDALFSILGTTYGGDGRTTFGLPDLRGRIPIHFGQGTELTNRVLGEKGGVETVTLTVAQMVSHVHEIPEPATASMVLLVLGAVAMRRRRARA